MRRFSSALALLLVTALGVGGCGGGGSDSTVTVKTGSLSKAQFVKRANTICTQVRTQFLSEYGRFVENAKGQATSDGKFGEETIEKFLLPNYEKRMLTQIETLGAPEDFASEVSDFLETLEQRLEEIREEPKKLTNTPFPFASVQKAAKAAGLEGCAGSFS